MKLIKTAAAAGLARAAWTQARKPENQARIKGALAKARSSRTSASTRTSPLSRRPR